LESDGFQRLFLSDEQLGSDVSTEEIIFPGMSKDKYRQVHKSFVSMTKRRRGLRSFQSLNTGTKNSLEHFYHVMEHVPYLFDAAAREGYKGGRAINKRPRVETSLVNKFGKRGYYVIAFYCICNWRHMKTVSVFRPHEALSANSKEKEKLYLSQFHYRCWFQLFWCIMKQWRMTLPDFPKVELTLDSVEKFTVTNPHHKIL
jgi:hypothetical protein